MKFNSKILKILLVVLIFFSLSTININASTNIESNVISDLCNDPNFNIDDYPSISIESAKENPNIKTLQLIQIAESDNKELFLYVYQPINNDLLFISSSISMSIGYSKDGQDLNPSNYELELISYKDTFCKYKVLNYTVSDNEKRYYNIICIRRYFDYSFDKQIPGTELVGNEKVVDVGQQWYCYNTNDGIKYEMNTFETLEIKVKYTGNLQFDSGYKFGNVLGKFDYGLSWFICFDLIDYIALKIYDADLTYKIRDATRSVGLGLDGNWKYGDWSDDIKLTLSENDTASYNGEGLFSKNYTWNRIMTSKDFLENAENQKMIISDEAKENILNSQWVFAFAETEMNFISGTSSSTTYSKDISKIAILRINFFNIDKKTYNLGVVSDRVNPDNISDGYGGNKDLDDLLGESKDLFKKIIQILAIIVLIVVLYLFTPIIKVLFQGIIYILSLPFKLIKWIFKKDKTNK